MTRAPTLLLALLLAGVPVAAPASPAPAAAPAAPYRSRADMVAAVMPSVVQIRALVGDPSAAADDEAGPARTGAAAGGIAGGTGFIVAADGLVVTNAHVVAGARQVMVRLADGSDRPAAIVGQDARTDVALLRLEGAQRYPALAWGNSEALRPGDDVVAVGSPFGLGGTVTAGIVSGRGRVLGGSAYEDYIQIDAPINHGNSGGPLLDMAGRVVGMNAAIVSPNDGSVGIGFSIPATMVRRMVADLLARGRVSHGVLGIVVEEVTADEADALGLPKATGALIAAVEDSSAAAAAGLRTGDVVLAVDDHPVADFADLSERLADVEAGAAVRLEAWREGRRLALTATAAAPQSAAAREQGFAALAAAVPAQTLLGLSLTPATPALDAAAGQPADATGLIVAAVAAGSPAAERQITPGDIVAAVGGRALDTPDDLATAVAAARAAGRHHVLLTVARGAARTFIALPLG